MSHLTGENHVQAQKLSGDSGVTVLASLLHKRPNLADAAIAGIAHSQWVADHYFSDKFHAPLITVTVWLAITCLKR